MGMTPSDRPEQASARRRPPVVTFVVVPLIPFMLIGLVALVYGGTLAVDQWRFLRQAEHAKGTVVGLNKYARGAYPIVRYGAPNGESIQFQSRIRRSYGIYKIDQEVGVLYDPADLRRAEIDSPDARYAVLMLPLFGAGLLDGQPRDGRLAGATEIEARLDGLEQPMSFGLRDSQQYADHLHRQLGGHVDDEVERLAVDDRVQQAPCPRSQIVLDPGDHPRCQAGTHQATNLGVTRVVHHVEHLASDGQILEQRAAVRP